MPENLDIPKLKSNDTKKKVKLKKKPLIFLIALAFLVTISATIATYFSETSVANRFQAKTYNVTLDEEFNNTWGTKKVFIRNNENATAIVIRVSYNEVWSQDVDGTVVIHSNKVDNKEVALKAWTTTFTNDFILKDDGWYYYKKVLQPGSSIQLLSTVNKNTAVDFNLHPEYNSSDYELTFTYEAIQATEAAVLELWGKTITINGGNVTWN